ncbi:unnamed protein product [Didymodactylos carnosus]|uniref:Uncharacterized protein n=1 Tax=Didymodactylos carnosus TaxID=1234261 RepID=A0A813YPG9_9BILA|nr:unnamed protein product [Didymodactylos carnosus]CAF1053907.1 unnamed protein product [Didymodactylos carnosus]CAF3672415.1 unnamed protein product [Didymodactylos carnosus]CAF3820366.1 unnamed protein product [Didymodactylos carnosus]
MADDERDKDKQKFIQRQNNEQQTITRCGNNHIEDYQKNRTNSSKTRDGDPSMIRDKCESPKYYVYEQTKSDGNELLDIRNKNQTYQTDPISSSNGKEGKSKKRTSCFKSGKSQVSHVIFKHQSDPAVLSAAVGEDEKDTIQIQSSTKTKAEKEQMRQLMSWEERKTFKRLTSRRLSLEQRDFADD